MKCLTRRRCWYCEDRCENCMEPAAVGLAEERDGVVLKFCSEDCRCSFKHDPKVLNLLPAIFKICIKDGNVSILSPPKHVVFQRIVDTLYDDELDMNSTRTVYICFGDGSTHYPRDSIYILYQYSTVLRQTLLACFVSDDLSLHPLSVSPQCCDIEVAKSHVDYLHSCKTVKSMLQAVLSDAGFTSFLGWRLYNLFTLGIAYFP